MSPLLMIGAASAAALLTYGRKRRLAGRLPLPRIARAKSRALAEAILAALTVLLVGWLIAPAIDPATASLRPFFLAAALLVAWLQFNQTWRARRTRGA
ncbi:hypothetical protein [Rhizorhabdus dicambivorans]|uniref:Uncharacterized protein n=1 Tax=Rhizorhabdus dicambivorans TaxID=1850238 RepID=A0A2A4FWI5_9SPHN|nr:hypothetical protein [Rhizorhabdus dicambivorans]ATE66143.1 hypothetical protein CMV14_18485 [Rhizorhabdus dicambivorans]PCE42069.1 hypothetical protein COO09_12190 [Rhizorhabdus dicambivorans]